VSRSYFKAGMQHNSIEFTARTCTVCTKTRNMIQQTVVEADMATPRRAIRRIRAPTANTLAVGKSTSKAAVCRQLPML